MFIGAGVGVIAGLAGTDNSGFFTPQEAAAALGAALGLLGAGVGAIVGFNSRHEFIFPHPRARAQQPAPEITEVEDSSP